jgi:hypothetical protein
MKTRYVLTIGLILLVVSCNDKRQQQVLFGTVPEPYRFSGLQSRAVTQENPTGGKGLGGKDRGNGNARKGAPAYRFIEPGETKVLCDIEGQGMIRHIWMTLSPLSGSLNQRSGPQPYTLRNCIISMYWDDCETPSVEAPVSDFFGIAHGRKSHYVSPYLDSPAGRAYNCYFPMPFSKRARITFRNDTENTLEWLFYQVDYTSGDKITDDMGRFHASFRRNIPEPGHDYVLLDTKGSPGVYVGMSMGVIPHGRSWWGEGEFKFYIDGDEAYPTICGTGLEDYINTGWGLDLSSNSMYAGVNFHLPNDPRDKENERMGEMMSFYRFHVWDPIYFQSSLRIEVQQLGAGFGSNKDEAEAYKAKINFKDFHRHPNTEKPGKMMSDWLFDRVDDYCSTVYWYQQVRENTLPPFPDREERSRDVEVRPWEKHFTMPVPNPVVRTESELEKESNPYL